MDNLSIDVTAEGDKALRHAMEIMWSNAAGGKATHYAIKKYREETTYYDYTDPTRRGHSTHLIVDPVEGVETLVLCWHADRDAIALPYAMVLDRAFEFVKGWLSENKPPRSGWGSDVECNLGFRMFTDGWGHVGDNSYAIFGIQPAWALYGK